MVLKRTPHRPHRGQEGTGYRAQAPWVACRLRADCLTQAPAKPRTLKVADDPKLPAAARQRFGETEPQDRYRHRGEKVETVFGFLRGTLGYPRWLLRGAKKAAGVAQWFKNA